MVTSKQCFDKWGDPATTHDEGTYMVMWDVPSNLEIGVIPKRIYCNKVMIGPLSQGFQNLITRGFINELKTWDGCFNIRKKRGLSSPSLHSWGVAFDVNAFENGLGVTPKLSAGFVKCFTDAGFDWGGTWTRKDGMHFQLAKI
jgi:hypothetical protein